MTIALSPLERIPSLTRTAVLHLLLVATLSTAVASCTPSTTTAGTLRVVDGTAKAEKTRPICFDPKIEGLSLTEATQRNRVVTICEAAAQAEGLRVLPLTDVNCLVATVQWYALDSGTRSGECTRTFMGSECDSKIVFQKTLRVFIAERSSKRATVESTAALHSRFEAFTDRTFKALCSAAFQSYPKALNGEEIEVVSETE